MKWCQPHWDKLRAAIDVRGLTRFVAKDAAEAAASVEAGLEGGKAPFDPLLGSWSCINTQMLKDIGLRAMGRCPLCILVEDGRPELVDNWVNGVSDHALEYAANEGLVQRQ